MKNWRISFFSPNFICGFFVTKYQAIRMAKKLSKAGKIDIEISKYSIRYKKFLLKGTVMCGVYLPQ